MALMNHIQNIRHCIDLAFDARKRGDHPFGAMIAFTDGRILSASNTVISEGDNTCHAEINAIRAGARHGHVLVGATLYSSTEPCVMCAGAIFWAGISQVVYSCSSARLADFTGGSLTVPCREVFERGRRATEVIGPLIEDEAAATHHGFWVNHGSGSGKIGSSDIA